MKVIDLLVRIANNEDIGKLKFKGDEYEKVCGNEAFCYYCKKTNETLAENIYTDYSSLNEEIEIIDNKIEKLELEPLKTDEDLSMQIELVHYENLIIANKINELIDYINKE